jgi:hypothetical protein
MDSALIFTNRIRKICKMFMLRGKTKKLPPLSPRKSFKEASRTENNLCFVLTGLPDELVCAQ